MKCGVTVSVTVILLAHFYCFKINGCLFFSRSSQEENVFSHDLLLLLASDFQHHMDLSGVQVIA